MICICFLGDATHVPAVPMLIPLPERECKARGQRL